MRRCRLLIFGRTAGCPIRRAILLSLVRRKAIKLVRTTRGFSVRRNITFSLCTVRHVEKEVLSFLQGNRGSVLVKRRRRRGLFALRITPSATFRVASEGSLRSTISVTIGQLPVGRRSIVQDICLGRGAMTRATGRVSMDATCICHLRGHKVRHLHNVLSGLVRRHG